MTKLNIVFGGVSSHLLAIATEGGRSASFGATMLSAMFIAGMAGPVVAGAVVDWLGRPQALLPFIARLSSASSSWPSTRAE